jgi:hypothetical protein
VSTDPNVPPPPSYRDSRPIEIPYGLRISAAWSWRLLLVGVVIYLLGQGFVRFQLLML